MERKVGTISRGIRCPIIREGDDLARIVVAVSYTHLAVIPVHPSAREHPNPK